MSDEPEHPVDALPPEEQQDLLLQHALAALARSPKHLEVIERAGLADEESKAARSAKPDH